MSSSSSLTSTSSTASPSSSHSADDSMAMMSALSDIVHECITCYQRHARIELRAIISRACALHSLARAPKLVDVIAALPAAWRKRIAPLIQAKPIRSASGISVVAVMCKPHRCPHVALTKAVCLYCPGGPDSDFEYSTQAYTGYEPTCLTRDHEVLTERRGWRRIEELREKCDRVLTFNNEDMRYEWQIVEQCFRHRWPTTTTSSSSSSSSYASDSFSSSSSSSSVEDGTASSNARLFCMRNPHIDALCTANHRWPLFDAASSSCSYRTAVQLISSRSATQRIPLTALNQHSDHQFELRSRDANLALCSLLGFCMIHASLQLTEEDDGSMLLQRAHLTLPLMEKSASSSSSSHSSLCLDFLELLDEASVAYSLHVAEDGSDKKLVRISDAALLALVEPLLSAHDSCVVPAWCTRLSLQQARAVILGCLNFARDTWHSASKLCSSPLHVASPLIADCLSIVGALAQIVVETRAHAVDASSLHAPSRELFFLFASSPQLDSSIQAADAPVPEPVEASSCPQHDGHVYSLRVRNTNFYARRALSASSVSLDTDAAPLLSSASSPLLLSTRPYFTGNSMRAIRARYDPYKQTRNRVDQLVRLGHEVDKVEFIVMGGTFMSLPADYRDYFIRNLHDALSGARSRSVSEAIEYGEQSSTRCIGLTIETRPDWCLKPHLSQMLSYGCTRLEVGVQSVYEDVARDTNRGHSVNAVSQSFHLSKDAGFKIIAHMMPDLPNMGYERDLQQFVEYFENPSFRSDGLKLYPTLVIRGTGLYELWKTGQYKNYSPDELIELLSQILALVPPWTRVYRIQRDIPMPLVSSGVEHGNIRELVLARMKELGWKCRDIRTREIGIQKIHGGSDPDQVELVRRDYVANGGWETFLAYEDAKADTLIGLLRLRQCSDEAFRDELLPCPSTGRGASVVRELHVYGSAVPVHTRDPTKFQHHGLGTLLMEEAERIAREEHGSYKLAVISGVGTRHYYRKLGYELEGPYMTKLICVTSKMGSE